MPPSFENPDSEEGIVTSFSRAGPSGGLIQSYRKPVAQALVLSLAMVAGPTGLVYAQQPSAPVSPEAAAAGTYVNEAGDYVQLLSDGSFVLKFRGYTSRGSFTIQGQDVGLRIPEDTRTVKVRLIGSALVFPSGVTYTKRSEPSALNPPGQLQEPPSPTGPDRSIPSEADGRKAVDKWFSSGRSRVSRFTKLNGMFVPGGEGAVYCMEFRVETDLAGYEITQNGIIMFTKTERGWRADNADIEFAGRDLGRGKCG